MATAATPEPRPNPFLTAPVLYLGPGLTQATPDHELAELLWECLEVRLNLDRASNDPSAPLTGNIQFRQLEKAEKAYATVNAVDLGDRRELNLHISPDLGSDPQPLATPRMVKALPKAITAGAIYDLFRPFGPIYRVSPQMAPAYPPGSGKPTFKGTAVLTFYEEGDAIDATEALNFAEVEGQNIIVQDYKPSRARRSDASFVSAHGGLNSSTGPASPIGNGRPSLSPGASSFTPQRSFSAASHNSNHASPAAVSSPISPSGSLHGAPAGVDPSNLYIKGLDLALTSDDLKAAFAPYGTITSARVMFDDQAISKGFGFVSFEQPEQAAAALQGMNGQRLGPSGKPVNVRFHEPKAVREQKLKERFGGQALSDNGSVDSGLSRSLSGMAVSQPMSPSPSQGSKVGAAAVPAVEEEAEAEEVDVPKKSEHDRLVEGIAKVQPERVGELIDLIEALPKKERAMCLFNPGYLKQKVEDALLVLDASDDELEPVAASKAAPVPASGLSATAPPTSAAAPTPAVPASLDALARLPVRDIAALIHADALRSLGVVPIDPAMRAATDAFMDSFEGKPAKDVKQALGSRVHGAIKPFKLKKSPTVIIRLLDTEDLRGLAHVADYPEVLREKFVVELGA